MKFGGGAQDATQLGPGDAVAAGTVGGDGDGKPARSLQTQESLRDIQDIQDIIDKLAAITQQLRSSGRGPASVPDPAG
jgi:2-keto-4-pentenoate hydratase/2-oxohepta-3-ene-1,7-dioic acid hydratase in catechol pathway